MFCFLTKHPIKIIFWVSVWQIGGVSLLLVAYSQWLLYIVHMRCDYVSFCLPAYVVLGPQTSTHTPLALWQWVLHEWQITFFILFAYILWISFNLLYFPNQTFSFKSWLSFALEPIFNCLLNHLFSLALILREVSSSLSSTSHLHLSPTFTSTFSALVSISPLLSLWFVCLFFHLILLSVLVLSPSSLSHSLTLSFSFSLSKWYEVYDLHPCKAETTFTLLAFLFPALALAASLCFGIQSPHFWHVKWRVCFSSC